MTSFRSHRAANYHYFPIFINTKIKRKSRASFILKIVRMGYVELTTSSFLVIQGCTSCFGANSSGSSECSRDGRSFIVTPTVKHLINSRIDPVTSFLGVFFLVDYDREIMMLLTWSSCTRDGDHELAGFIPGFPPDATCPDSPAASTTPSLRNSPRKVNPCVCTSFFQIRDKTHWLYDSVSL